MSAKGVNVQNGRFNYSSVDLAIGPFSLKRSLGDDALYPITRTFGPGYTSNRIYSAWGHSYAQGSYLKGSDSLGNLIVFVVDGKELQFRSSTGPVFLPQNKSSQGNRLSVQNGNFVLVDRDGSTYNFLQHPAFGSNGTSFTQLLSNVLYADGSRLDYTYNSLGQVRTVISNMGYALVFDYNAQNNLAAVCGFNLTTAIVMSSTTCVGASRRVTYGYNAAGTLLTSVTDAEAGVVNISYVTAANAPWPSCITFRNSATCEISNEFGGSLLIEEDQVTRQTTPMGDVWQYSYDNGEDPADLPIVAGRPRWTFSNMDGAGGYADMRYDRGLLVEYSGPLSAGRPSRLSITAAHCPR